MASKAIKFLEEHQSETLRGLQRKPHGERKMQVGYAGRVSLP